MSLSEDIRVRTMLTRAWYTEYDAKNEYDYNPRWTSTIVETAVSTDDYITTTTFYEEDNENAWISSELVYDLTRVT